MPCAMIAALLPKRINAICTYTKPTVPCIIYKLQPLSLDFSPLRPVSGYSQIPVFLTVFFVPSHQLGMLFVLEQTFQPWYYRSISHHLGRNLLPRVLALDITRVIAANLIAQCTAYRASVQILVLTAVEDAVIRACMYLLHL